MSSNQSVPKPPEILVAVEDGSGRASQADGSKPKGDGFGSTASVAEACKRAYQAGSQIIADLGSLIGSTERRRVLSVFRRTLFPARRPGRRPKETITAAHRDWKNGMHGPALYRAHIPDGRSTIALDGSAKRELLWMQSARGSDESRNGRQGRQSKNENWDQPVWRVVQLNRK